MTLLDDPDRFDPELYDQMKDFKLWGFDLQQLRSMRDFAINAGWKFNEPKPDRVKHAIDHIIVNHYRDIPRNLTGIELERLLRELVALVRAEKQ